jgi:tetratricopeptide (TPR) repeat protein
MAERIEEPEVQLEQGVEPVSPGAAFVIGARKGRARDKADPKLDAFLDEQTDLIRLQKEHLHEQRLLVLSRLRWGRFSDRMRAILQVLTAAVGLAVVAVVGAMAWQAHRDHGVVIEAFSVPPDLAQRGVTGQVVASELLDRLSDLQAKTVTARPASTYANDWGDDIKVEIPETGVSIGELNRYLRQWLGSETQISGEVLRTPSGLALTARAGASSGKRFEGAETDLDKLVGQAAEALYQETQPYRYAVYLASQGRKDEAVAAYQRVAQSGDPDERAWAYTGWATLLLQDDHDREAARLAEAAIRLNPRLYPAYPTLALSLSSLGHAEEVVPLGRREIDLIKSGQAIGLSGQEVETNLRFLEGMEAYTMGDDGRAIALSKRASGAFTFEGQAQGYTTGWLLFRALADSHDIAASRRVESSLLAAGAPDSQLEREGPVFQQEAALDDWAPVVPMAERAFAASKGDPRAGVARARVARAYAHVGRLAEADALISQTPMDCLTCITTRGLIAARKRDWAQADRWYAEAMRQSPSLSDAPYAWGQALLDKGDIDGAIAKLGEAHRRSPRWADPLEVWGDALMAKRDYAGAISKFAEADKTAPRWGRNHLRWGEALMLSGRYAEARRQYQAADGMDLSTPDRAALNVLLARTASGPLHG